MQKNTSKHKVLLLKPASQADSMVNTLCAAGMEVHLMPTIEIAAMDDISVLRTAVNKIQQYDIAIFTSRHAVDHALRIIQKFPAQLTVFAIGPATQQALVDGGISIRCMPEHYNSEGLLALPELSRVDNKQIVVFAGVGGRTLLIDSLIQRGAKITKVECYRRLLPKNDINPQLAKLKKNGVDVMVVTSNEIVENLLVLADKMYHSWLCKIPVIAPSERVAAYVQQRGFTADILVAENASEDGILRALGI